MTIDKAMNLILCALEEGCTRECDYKDTGECPDKMMMDALHVVAEAIEDADQRYKQGRLDTINELGSWIMEAFVDWCEGDVRQILNHIDYMQCSIEKNK